MSKTKEARDESRSMDYIGFGLAAADSNLLLIYNRNSRQVADRCEKMINTFLLLSRRMQVGAVG